MIKIGLKQAHVVFRPRHMHARVTIHSLATVTGAAVAVRMGWGGAPMWANMAWYCGGFVGFHIILMPFMAGWYMAVNRVEAWVRGIIQEELLHFEMKGYERQLLRMLPTLSKRSDDDAT